MHPLIKENAQKEQEFWADHPEFSQYSDSDVIIEGHRIKVFADYDCDSDYFSDIEEGDCGISLCNLKRPEQYGPRQMLVEDSVLIHALFFGGPQTWEVTKFKNQYWYLPVYRYSHSGVEYSTKPFNCRWDSGLAGLIYIKKKDLLESKYAGIKPKTPAFEKSLIAEMLLQYRLEEFNDAVNNNYWAVEVSAIYPDREEELDCAYGYLGQSSKILGITGALELVKSRVEELKKVNA